MENEIVNVDSKGAYHGTQIWYNPLNFKLKLRGKWIHGVEIGYEEWHKTHEDPETNFFIR